MDAENDPPLEATLSSSLGRVGTISPVRDAPTCAPWAGLPCACADIAAGTVSCTPDSGGAMAALPAVIGSGDGSVSSYWA